MRVTRAATPIQSATVRVHPGMTPETTMLTSYRHDGTVFLRVELPADLAPSWVSWLEKYTRKHDTSKPAAMRLVR